MTDVQRLATAVLSTSSDAIIATDRDGVIGFWNPGAQRIFGHRRQEAIGQSLDLIIPENQRARHWHGYRQVMQTGESRYGHGDLLSVPALHKDGHRISVEFTVTPLMDENGTVEGMIALLRDVTVHFEEMRALRMELAERRR
jgi:PAS domain S-box-containing protein